ncbi:unnamed protein product, partial [Citrullus colocynthis]
FSFAAHAAERRRSCRNQHCSTIFAAYVAAFAVAHELPSKTCAETQAPIVATVARLAIRFHSSVTIVAAVRGTLLLLDFVMGRFGWVFLCVLLAYSNLPWVLSAIGSMELA